MVCEYWQWYGITKPTCPELEQIGRRFSYKGGTEEEKSKM